MKTLISKPLVACATNEDSFCNRVEEAAAEIGSDFLSSDDLDSAVQQCSDRLSCIVVDYESAVGFNSPLNGNRSRQARSLIVVVPQGDVRAAFRAASAGAVTILEKPDFSSHLVVNLKTALASEMRMEDFRSGQQRFTDPLFDELSTREKAILSLLMEGEPNKRVASILDVGLRTVEAERAQVIKKLNVGSFVELIRLVTCVENDVSEARKSIFGSIMPRENGFRA